MRLGDQEPLDNATPVFKESPKLTRVAQTLAAHGGGALSVDLALDIVLNDVVEQARAVTGATGAAIAMFRDWTLTCRASSGENAPDLGVPVDASSGLAGACVSTGEMQQCQDTETDGRVNAETCRQLGVRSMLIAPLVDGQRLVGLIQVFSPWPNAFGKREISALQVLAGRIAESNREAEAVITMPVEEPELPVEEQETPLEEPEPPVEEHETSVEEPEPLLEEQETPAEPAEFQLEPMPNEAAEEQPEQLRETIPVPASAPRKGFDLWSTVLGVLVIAAAVALGLMIGWRRATESTKRPRQANPSVRTDASSISGATVPTASPNEVTPDPVAAHTGSAPVSTTKAPVAKPEAPLGGLIVTQNGKVVYRSSSSGGQPVAGLQIERQLVHRVEPEYPAQARAQHVQGPVVLDVQVLGDGEVGTIAIVSGDPVLAQSAVDAVKHWRYQPESEDGQGLRRQTRITVKFTLPQS